MSYIRDLKLHSQQISAYTSKFFRSILPIASVKEIKKIIPVFGLFFLISFVYHILRCLKITLNVKAYGSGAEVVPFIKFWLVMPSAIIFTYFYARLARNENRKILIYNILGLFSAFFLVFMIFLYPYKEQLHLNNLSTWLTYNLPKGLHGIIPMLCNWPETMFYIIAEMWSIIVLSILFWGFCNETTKIEDAKRFYALIALGANCAGMFSGKYMQFISSFFGNTPNSWSQSVTTFMLTVIICCLLIVMIFMKLNNLHNNSLNQPIIELKTKKFQHKISLLESVRYIFRYKYIALLAIMVVTYNIVFNLADFLWIDQLNKRFLLPHDLNNYLAQLDFLVGIFSLIIGLFIFTNMMNKFGWTITAMMPPIIWLITSVGLYTTIFTEKFGLSVNNLILILGTLQISLGKAVKYCIFDQIKEMSFIPLSIEQQRNSKAIIDGIISRFGKSSSSIILQGFLIFGLSDIASLIPIVALIIIITIFVWGYATCKMGTRIKHNQLIDAN